MNTLKRKILTLFCVILPLFCLAQNTLPRQYDYDAAGNRISRKVITMNYVPPAPSDSTLIELETFASDEFVPPESQESSYTATTSEFYVEYIAQTEIKIYPNPTTEKVTLEIAGWETLQTGVFKLFTMNGQLLQERPVHSVATEISLAGLAKGAYILKVEINDYTEDWKIIKN
jgi:hypothetical protein